MVNTDRLCMGCMNDNGGEKVCPICGYDASEDNAPRHLQAGSWLNANRYLIGKVIEESGDGVTYIGWDNDLNAVVNVKEYFPTGIAVRSADRITVTPAEDRALAFNRGMEQFVELFTKLGKLPESTAILRVVDAFDANGTVYAVQSTVSGTTLKSFLLRNGGSLKWEQAKPLFMALIASVAELHEAGIIHGGICPDNVIVGRDGKLRLTGFCIKEARIEHTEFLSQLASGYAAPEQYLENDPYSTSCDVYAVGAVLFRTLIGTTLPDAKDRLMSDRLSIPAKVTEVVPKGVLVSVASTLKVDKNERVNSLERFYKMLESVAVGSVSVGDTAEKEEKKGGGKVLPAVIASLITTVILIILFGIGILLLTLGGYLGDGKDDESTPSSDLIVSIDSSQNQGYAPGTSLYVAPDDFIGRQYTEVYGEMQTTYAHFKFEVAGRIPSDTVARGAICDLKVGDQTVKEGEEYPRDTVMKIYISQGKDQLNVPKIVGVSVEEAKAMLFDAGFYSDTIILRKAYDEKALPGNVFKVTLGDVGGGESQAIGENTKVSVNELIIVYYREAEPEPDQSQNDFSNNNPELSQ